MIALSPDEKKHIDKDRCIAFQTDVLVKHGTEEKELRPRTLEEAFVYENFELIQSKKLSIGVEIPEPLNDVYKVVFDRVRSDEFKKTDFAMDILASNEKWVVPNYIVEGLKWLEIRLCTPIPFASDMSIAAVSEESHGN